MVLDAIQPGVPRMPRASEAFSVDELFGDFDEERLHLIEFNRWSDTASMIARSFAFGEILTGADEISGGRENRLSQGEDGQSALAAILRDVHPYPRWGINE